MSDAIFGAYGRYYDLLYRDKDYVAETDYIVGLLDRFGVTGKSVLEFGSGTGKHGRLLAERGYSITGIERSAEMVLNTETVPGFACHQGDICTLHLRKTFDAVLSLFHVVSYLTTNEEVRGVFVSAAEHLQPGGLFLFDVWYSPAVYAQKPEVRVKRIADESLEIIRLAEPVSYPNENRVNVNYTIWSRDLSSDSMQAVTETHPMRHFSLPELELLAGMYGFQIAGSEEFLTGTIPSEATWGICVILKKT